MKKTVSALLVCMLLIASFCISVSASTTTSNDEPLLDYGTQLPSLEQEHVHDEYCNETPTIVVVDELGNVLSPDSYHFISSRLFPCCKDWRQNNLTSVVLYQHWLYGTTCEMESQKGAICNACGYYCPDSNTWKAAGSHSIVTQKGKNGCPY